jgi:hypothetical protein
MSGIWTGWLILLLAAGIHGADDPAKPETPARVKKASDEPLLEENEEDPALKLMRVAKNMRAAEERLKQSDAGNLTRQIQRTIVKDLDALIQESPPPTNQSSPQQPSDHKNPRSKSRESHSSSKPKRRQASGEKNASKPMPLDREKSLTSGTGGNTKDKAGMTKLGELYKDIWGHLPETMRQEMDQYSREEFMAKYSDLLKEYYSRIAEKGRRKGE